MLSFFVLYWDHCGSTRVVPVLFYYTISLSCIFVEYIYVVLVSRYIHRCQVWRLQIIAIFLYAKKLSWHYLVIIFWIFKVCIDSKLLYDVMCYIGSHLVMDRALKRRFRARGTCRPRRNIWVSALSTAVLKKHWWKHNEQKKLFSQYGFWTWNNLKYPKLKCFGEGFYNIFIFEGFFSIILLIFARYFRYLKLPTLQRKSFEK